MTSITLPCGTHIRQETMLTITSFIEEDTMYKQRIKMYVTLRFRN